MTSVTQKTENSSGSATVEAVVAFTGFLFTIFTILNIINFCRAQALISNAVDTTAKELSQYGYFYNMSGLQKFSEDMKSNADVGAEKINDVIGSVDGLYKSLGSALDNTQSRATDIVNALEDGSISSDTFSNALNGVEADGSNVESYINLVSANIDNIIQNPIAYLKSLAAIAGNDSLDLAKSRLIAVPLAKAFFTKHFGSTAEKADAELEALGVVDGLDGLNFNMSTIFNSEAPNDVHIVVYYRMQLIQLFKFAELNAGIRKDAVARVWLGGDDVIVKAKPSVTAAPQTSEPSGEETEKNNTESEKTTENTTEATTEAEPTTSVSYEGSLWELRDHTGFATEFAFDDYLQEDKNLTHLEGKNTSMGYYYTGNTQARAVYEHEEARTSCYVDFDAKVKCLKKFAESGDLKFGDVPYDPKLPLSYNMVIYVPENIPADVEKKMKQTMERKLQEYYEAHDANPEVQVSYEIIKAGGNCSDYGG